jgi:Na+-driven multidrug efflux pump
MVSQAQGAKDYVMCNNVLRAALAVLILLYIPLGIILFKIDFIMGEHMFNADPVSVAHAITYTRTIMVGFFFEAIYDLEKKYLLQFGNSIFPMLIQGITLPLHLILVTYFHDYDDSLLGIAMATNISFFLNFLILHVYITLITPYPYKFAPTF